MEEIKHRLQYYFKKIVIMAVDGVFLLSGAYAISLVHYKFLPSITMEGYYEIAIHWLAYLLDAAIAIPLTIKIIKEIITEVKKEVFE